MRFIKRKLLWIVSCIVLVFSVVALISVFMDTAGIWEPFRNINNFSTFAYALRTLTTAISLPLALFLLSLIGLLTDRKARD